MNHGNVTITRCVTNVTFSGMNLNIIRNVTRPVNSLFSVPRNITGTLLLPAVVRFGTPMYLSGCMRVTGTVSTCHRNVAGRRTTRTTYGTIHSLTVRINVPRRLARVNVGRRSVPTLTRRTVASIYAPNGPHRMAGRSVVTLCGGIL